MTTMSDTVNQVLTRLNGSVPGVLGRLLDDHAVGDGTLKVTVSKKVNPGTIVSAGLATFYVESASPDGLTFTVMPITADRAVLAGTMVRFSPVQTTAEVFDRLCWEISALSSPLVGLYAPAAADSEVNHNGGWYPLPSTWTVDPIRVLDVKGQDYGTDNWNSLENWEFQAETGLVLLYGPTPDVRSVRIIYAMPFTVPADLTTTLESCNIPESMQDIPVLGACSALALGLEGRRIRPGSQGDPRRADEVPMTAGTSVAREFGRARNQRVMEEVSRLARLYPYRQQPPVVSLDC